MVVAPSATGPEGRRELMRPAGTVLFSRCATLVTLATTTQATGRTPIPAPSPIGGLVWTYIVPALLFLVALGATWLLYRRFARR